MLELISLLLVDDQKLVREGVRALLEREGGFRIAGEAGDGQEAVDLYEALRPDVVLMDMQMPGMDGVAAIGIICGMDPEARVIILTTFDDDEYVFDGIGAGAVGYLLKTMSGDELAAAVRTVHGGGALLEPMVARKVVAAFGSRQAGAAAGPVIGPVLAPVTGPGGGEQAASRPAEGASGDDRANSGLPEPLSPRELEVLGLIAEGLSNRMIANRLSLAEGTIKNYVSSLIGKLNAQDRTQAALMSKDLGLIP